MSDLDIEHDGMRWYDNEEYKVSVKCQNNKMIFVVNSTQEKDEIKALEAVEIPKDLFTYMIKAALKENFI